MNFKKYGNYKLSFLERKKQLDILSKTESNINNQSSYFHNELIGNEHQHSINIISQKITFVFSRTPTNYLTIVGEQNNQSITQITNIITQSNPLLINRFYNTQQQGNVITTIYKFPNNNMCQRIKTQINQKCPDAHVVFCSDIEQLNEETKVVEKRVSIPNNPLLQKLIDKLAIRVVCNGYFFEKELIELNLPHFEFLRYYSYYRYKCIEEIIRIFNESSVQNVAFPIQLEENDCIYSSILKYASPPLLSTIKRQILIELMEEVDYTKSKIGKIMTFALDNSNSSAQIAYTLCKCPISTSKQLILRLYIISDILHNSLALNYPGLFKVLLPNLIFKCFKELSIKQQEKKKVFQIFDIWQQKLLVYQKQFFEGLQFTINKLIEIKDNNLENIYWHPQMFNKTEEQLYVQCNKLGLPTIGPYSIHLSMFLHESQIKKQGRVEQLYDGEDLTDEDLKKVKSSQADIMTYHSLDYLYNRTRKQK